MNKIEKFYSVDPGEYATSYFNYLGQILQNIDIQEIRDFVETLLDARERNATIFFIGNGGSASTCSHFANDLVVGTKTKKKHFRVLSLTDNNALLTAVGNDFGYSDIFSRQLRALGKSGDVVVAVSASGNSPNLLEALNVASDIGMNTVGITSFDGGKLKQSADKTLHVPTEPREYGPAEDAHLVLNHVVVAYLMQFLKDE